MLPFALTCLVLLIGSDERRSSAEGTQQQALASTKAVDALLQAIRGRGFDAVQEAINNVIGLKLNAAASAALQTDLRHPDARVRRLSAYALRQLDLEDCKRVVPALSECLEDGEPRLRARVTIALRNMGVAARVALPALTNLVHDEDSRVRAGAILALCELSPQPTTLVPLLTERLSDRAAPVRGTAAYALGQIGPAAHDALPVLVVMQSRDEDATVRSNATLAVESLDPPLPLIITALADRDAHHRLWAVTLLGRKGSAAKEGLGACIGLLKDENADVRAAAALTLGRMGTVARSAAPALLETLHDPAPDARSRATLALGLVGAGVDGIAPALVEALQDQSEEVAATAATALANLGPTTAAAVPRLVEMQQGASFVLRRRIIDVMARISGQSKVATPFLLKALQDTDSVIRRDAARALVSLGPQATVPLDALLEALRAHEIELDRLVRAWACLSLALGGAASEEVVPSLIETLHDEDQTVRTAAVVALGKSGAIGLPALVKALNHLDVRVRIGAAQAIGKGDAASARAIRPLVDALQDEDVTVRLAVMEAITRIATGLQVAQQTRSLPELEQALGVEQKISRDGSDDAQKTQWQAADTQLRAAVSALQTAKRAGVLESLGHSSWFLWLVGIVLYVSTLQLLWRVLLRFHPLALLHFGDMLRSVPQLKVPFLEMGVTLTDVLFVRSVQYHPRVLDAWVDRHLEVFRGNFANRQAMTDRAAFTPAPMEIDGKITTTPAPRELGRAFAGQRGCLQISGQAGSGKTTLVCQLARWALAADVRERLCAHVMLPVLITHELNGAPTLNTSTTLTEIIRGQLEALLGTEAALPESLLDALLRHRRVLVIIDQFSEMDEQARATVRPGAANFPVHALVIASRREELLNGIPRRTVVLCRPEQLASVPQPEKRLGRAA